MGKSLHCRSLVFWLSFEGEVAKVVEGHLRRQRGEVVEERRLDLVWEPHLLEFLQINHQQDQQDDRSEISMIIKSVLESERRC